MFIAITLELNFLKKSSKRASRTEHRKSGWLTTRTTMLKRMYEVTISSPRVDDKMFPNFRSQIRFLVFVVNRTNDFFSFE